jgi:hypothetical protein
MPSFRSNGSFALVPRRALNAANILTPPRVLSAVFNTAQSKGARWDRTLLRCHLLQYWLLILFLASNAAIIQAA